MDMKLDYCSLVDTQVRQAHYGPSVHHDSFSSASASSASFGPFSPASEQTSSSDHRLGSMGSCNFEAGTSAGSFSGLPMVDQLETAPSSSSMPNFFASLEMQQAQANMVAAAATVAPHMTSGYMSTSAFPQPPATPGRNSSTSSHNSSPITPANMLSSYPSSVTTPDSASPHHQNMLCGAGSSDAYFADMQHQNHRHQTIQHHGVHQQQQAYHTAHQQHVYREQQSPVYNIMATPSPAHSLRIENSTSPTDFMFNGNGRVESPIRDYFGERSANLPPLPPSATLPSSIVKNELVERYSSPEDADSTNLARRYSTASSVSSYASTNMAMHRQYSRMGDVRRNSEALQRISNRQYDYSSYANGSASPAAGGGHLVVRNGIRVSRVASGAFKCIVSGCPSRPFKRSEHLKRHVTTHHENKDTFPCEFCGRSFNRKDNWRSHLKLHTISRGKNARTDYFAKAVQVYNEEMRKVSKCRPRKEKLVHDE
ncbi:hypothetical protein CMQ_6732 [Grosmannia clavigera kw1407]|uniref:C2H2-type domain-containing protein n=1 Tax=Grosmannia clavigera (strain kw1407 / UAMH 11150) TaxID=655863 RepID=F0X706_GROCL|nr:uncharacterized protein CMQ_6732 [Grosmannia clavigera kw1407]EFX06411.1 hypothetical protein CMQ_6732 [Grosmannia clavigera kw1407]